MYFGCLVPFLLNLSCFLLTLTELTAVLVCIFCLSLSFFILLLCCSPPTLCHLSFCKTLQLFENNLLSCIWLLTLFFLPHSQPPQRRLYSLFFVLSLSFLVPSVFECSDFLIYFYLLVPTCCSGVYP